MTFMQRRNLSGNGGLRMSGRNIVKDRVKYLGLILETRLTYKFHFEMVPIKGMRALWVYRRAVGIVHVE